MANRLYKQMEEVVYDLECMAEMLIVHKKFIEKEATEEDYNEAFNKYRSQKSKYMQGV